MKRKKRKRPSRYNRMLRALARASRSGVARRVLSRHLAVASAERQRLIATNRRHHSADDTPVPLYDQTLLRQMPKGYRRAFMQALKLKGGKQALKRFRQFWRIPFPPAVSVMPDGKQQRTVLMGMGWTPEVHISDQKKGTNGKRVVVRGHWQVACTPNGRRILLLSGKRALGKRLYPLGYAPETNYLPTREMEEAGTFKAKTHWQHLHEDEGGVNPLVYADVPPASGPLPRTVPSHANFVYAPGTYTITDWIRR